MEEMERLGECEKKGERKEWKRKEKERKEKGKCWGSEVNGGGGVAAAVGCQYTDERTAWKDTYLGTLRRCSCDGRVGVYFGSDNDFGIYIPYLIYMQASLFVLHFCLFF